MSQLDYDFCFQYVSEFLTMVNYPIDNNISLIDKYHEEAIMNAKRKLGSSPYINSIIKEIDDDYNRQRFDYIKENVADVDMPFFNERITNMKRLLIQNQTNAVKLGMKISPATIDDYYNNYLIALEYTLRADINPVLR